LVCRPFKVLPQVGVVPPSTYSLFTVLGGLIFSALSEQGGLGVLVLPGFNLLCFVMAITRDVFLIMLQRKI
jgi:hypothetical protein